MNIGVVGLQFGRHMLENELLAGPGAKYFTPTAICDLDPVVCRNSADVE